MNLAATDPAFSAYHVPDDAWDELGRHQLAPHWQGLLRSFGDATTSGTPGQLRADFMVRDWDAKRPWPVDPLPFSMDSTEWRQIEAGLTQRATLLNLIVKDLYTSRTLLQRGGLPPALVFGNPRYLLPLSNYQAHDDNYLNLLAFDLGRSPDGQWRVLADWTEAPQGLGMCLENRVLVNQAWPELFQRQDTTRMADFFLGLAQQLRGEAKAVAEGTTVILSPGPAHPAYFEHVYLGQYFGFPVVEGADLTVRGNALQLKTLEGLKRVGCVLRYPDSTVCDALYLDRFAPDGVAGLVNTARDRHVHLANALGSGVVENDAFMSFLPGLCERFLGEPLHLPNLATWWTGQPDASAHVAQHGSGLSILPAFQREDAMLGNLSLFQDVQHSQIIPLDYQSVAREPIRLSHAPYFAEDGALHAAPVAVRLYAARMGKGYRLLPGGIARLSTPQGEISKDIWVKTDAVRAFPVKRHETSDNSRRRSDRDIPSRTADHLFWLGRYLERCENVVRTFRSLLNQMIESGSDDREKTLAIVVGQLVRLDGLTPAQAARLLQPGTGFEEHDWPRLLFETQDEGTHNRGLFGLVASAYNLASQVRGRLSPDAWRMFTALSNTQAEERFRVHRVVDALKLLDGMIERLSGLSGQMQENMTQSYGWRLLELGRRLERGQFVMQVLKELVTREATPSHMHQLLELSDSTLTYRARYQTIPQLDHLLHLLLLDEANPRSILYQIEKLQAVMAEMPLDQPGEGMSESQRLLLSARHELILSDPKKLADVVSKAGNRTQLRRVLQRLEKTLASLSELVTATYFAHTVGSRRGQ